MAYMNLDTFEITKDIKDNTVQVDDLIAKTISLLNKKGYYTMACCSGHNKHEEGYTEGPEADIKKLMDNELCEIVSKENGIWKMKCPLLGVSCYVKFKDGIKLPSIPEHFELINQAIYYPIDFYNDDFKRKSNQEIENNIMIANRLLDEWVNQLPQ